MKVITIIVGFLIANLTTGHAQKSPVQQLQKVEKKVFSILTSQASKQQIGQQLKPIFNSLLDFKLLAQKSLHKNWDTLSKAQQKEFTNLLQDLIEAAYVSRVQNTEKFSVRYTNETVTNKTAHVTTTIIAPGGQVSLGFKLSLIGKTWKVYDMIIDDVSLVRNYRTQFRNILKKKSYTELVKKMKNKLKHIQKKNENQHAKAPSDAKTSTSN